VPFVSRLDCIAGEYLTGGYQALLIIICFFGQRHHFRMTYTVMKTYKSNVSHHGFWPYMIVEEVFVSFENFPWFRDVPIGHLLNVQLPQKDHSYWPDLDIDFAVESLNHPSVFFL